MFLSLRPVVGDVKNCETFEILQYLTLTSYLAIVSWMLTEDKALLIRENYFLTKERSTSRESAYFCQFSDPLSPQCKVEGQTTTVHVVGHMKEKSLSLLEYLPFYIKQ